ncbi:WD40/YVTN/BNR-like repeat-containing protein [Brevibacillus laterosporus]|uniref:WD40/YVTN/BNR-like repeat-containing protein n=1 Tax=Brevibacillus laterosporus TaxID=1465 RepID=UPI000E6CDC50|nr:hypothetical protein [Brevibacillus laterosporus]AYB40038.1 hypothetical protein D5F52_18180 [Brevibacillus laterosporus]MBM7108443.1 hypothetical protein [Brevibacillus laterosporus]
MDRFTLKQLGASVSVLLLLSGCATATQKSVETEIVDASQTIEEPVAKQSVKLAQITGELTYQDVLQKGDSINSLALDQGGEQVWLATHSGLYASADHGLWGAVADELEHADVKTIYFDPTKSKRVYVAGAKVCKVSKDGGKTWKKIEGGLPHGYDIQSLIGVPTDKGTSLYAFVNREGVYESKDAGASWRLRFPIDTVEGYDLDYVPGEEKLYVLTQNELLSIGIHDGEWQVEWRESDAHIYSIAANKSSDALYAASDKGILIKDGKEWTLLSSELPEKLINISYGTADTPIIGIGESAQIYRYSQEKWKKWE